MNIKKLFLPIMVLAMMLVSTVCYAATSYFAVSPAKSSGQVGINEKINYVVTTSSKTYGLKTVTVTIKDKSTGAVIGTPLTGTCKEEYTTKVTMKATMPSLAYANIVVTVNVTDKSNVSKDFTYNYTMDATNKFTIDATPASGKLSVGQPIELLATASQVGHGIVRMEYKMYDGSNNQVDEDHEEADEEEKEGASFGYNIFAPNEAYENLKLVVKVTDIDGRTAEKTFNYTMDAPRTDMSFSVYSQTTNAKISNNAKVAALQAALVRIISSNEYIGIKTLKVKITNTATNGVVFTDTKQFSETYGVNPLNYKFSFPDKAGNYRMDLTVIDCTGRTHTAVFYFTVDGSLEIDKTNKLSITADYANGSQLAVNTRVKFTSTSTNQSVGTKTINLDVYKDDKYLEPRSATSSYASTVGSNPMSYTYLFKEQGKYKVVVKVKDVAGNEKEATFNYTVGTETVNTDTTISLSFNPSNNSDVETGDQVRITAVSSNSSDKIDTIKFYMYDDDKDEVDSRTSKSFNSTTAYYDLTIPKSVEDCDYITIKAIANTMSGKTTEGTVKYYLDDDDDDEDDESFDKGVINPDLDDLAIDLWTKDNNRMYEYKDEIDFVAYYYNFEKTSKKNVVIEVEIPDGFTVRSKQTDYGSVTYKNNVIKYTIGTVPSKTLREVTFTLYAGDDGLSETDQTIVASIYSDKDDLEDTSTQRIYIYESGEKGNRKAFVTGYTDGTFRPDNNITREEVAAMMARAFNYSANSVTKTFKDVKTTSWSYKYVAGCFNKNIIKGYTDGTFKPYNNITISELYTMTYRAMGISDEEKALFVPKRYKKETSWETNYVAGLHRLGMVSDKHMKDADVDENATRAQVVYLISRVQFRNTSGFKVGYYYDVDGSYWNAKDIEAASYNYSYKRTSSGKETVTTSGTYLDTNSNYIK